MGPFAQAGWITPPQSEEKGKLSKAWLCNQASKQLPPRLLIQVPAWFPAPTPLDDEPSCKMK